MQASWVEDAKKLSFDGLNLTANGSTIAGNGSVVLGDQPGVVQMARVLRAVPAAIDKLPAAALGEHGGGSLIINCASSTGAVADALGVIAPLLADVFRSRGE